MIFLRIFIESFKFAIHALRVNMLRTTLSLLGITVGIFTIISIFTVVDSLERSVRNSLSSLGDDVIYVQKMPWGGGDGDYEWWKYFQRPNPGYFEFKKLEKRVNSAEFMVFGFGMSKTVKRGLNSIENVTVQPVSHHFQDMWEYDIDEGRYFSPLESKAGSPVAVLGKDVAEGLFLGESPIGKDVKLMGRKLKVIGVYEKQGQSIAGQGADEYILVPVSFIRTIINVEDRSDAFIMIKAKQGYELDELKDDVRGQLRSIRRLKPKADDNFAMNESSLLTDGLDMIFGILGMVGLIIGGFSILVGGFGIANIMFVSVRERTNQIGIQKSLGAKAYFILLQFLMESIILCIIGGLFGLVLVYGLMLILQAFSGFDFALSLSNVAEGLALAVGIGIVSGYIPAHSAARLDPVEAIRAGQ